jgi:transcriptional regulator with XRE-family HTH domain
MDKSIYTREYAALLRLLRKAREDAGMTQVALAEALAEALGTSQSFVNKVEQGDRRLDVIQLRTIITVFGLILPDFSRRLERAITSEGVGRR